MAARALPTIALLLAACASSPEPGRTAPADDGLAVPGDRVGVWALGTGTLRGILGTDSLKKRAEFGKKGIWFQFDRGLALTGVTVTSSEFATREGIRVGSPAAAVRDAYGEPLAEEIADAGKGLQIPALVYPGIIFGVEGETVVFLSVTRPRAVAPPTR
jgi:hypothetical protein